MQNLRNCRASFQHGWAPKLPEDFLFPILPSQEMRPPVPPASGWLMDCTNAPAFWVWQSWSQFIESYNHLIWKELLKTIWSNSPAVNRLTYSSIRCSEPHPAWHWVSAGMGHPSPLWAICSNGFCIFEFLHKSSLILCFMKGKLWKHHLTPLQHLVSHITPARVWFFTAAQNLLWGCIHKYPSALRLGTWQFYDHTTEVVFSGM